MHRFELDLVQRYSFVGEFEEAFARHSGCKFAVACTSGTAALHLAALGIGPEDEVIMPAFTMIATANAVRYTGAAVKLVNSEPNHLNIDVDLVGAAITPRTKAIIACTRTAILPRMKRLQAIAASDPSDRRRGRSAWRGNLGQRVGGRGLAAPFRSMRTRSFQRRRRHGDHQPSEVRGR